MPFYYVYYFNRPVFIGKTERQRKKLRDMASKMLAKNPRHSRAMLIIRLNQPRQTIEQVKNQYERTHGKGTWGKK